MDDGRTDGGRNIPSAFLRRYNIFRVEMATAAQKKGRKKRFAYYVGYRTWSDDASAAPSAIVARISQVAQPSSAEVFALLVHLPIVSSI